MTYNFSYIYPEMDLITRKEAYVKRLLEKDLSFQSFDNAYVLPSKDLWKDGKCFGGVVSEKGEFIESSAWHEGKRCDKYDFDENSAIERDDVAIYMGFYNPCWGHAITDNLKKLWFVETDICKKFIAEGAIFIYLTVSNQPMPEYINRLFELAGVELASFELVTELSRFKKIIIPDNSFIADNGQRLFTKEYKKTIETIKINCSETKEILPEKIYFTRTKIINDRDFGEKTIERVFKKKGFFIVSPELFSVEEQINMLSHCHSFAATEGSISHNAVFCNSGTAVTIIRKCNDVNKYQMAVNEAADVNVTYIDAHRSTKVPKEAPWVGPFFLYYNYNIKQWSRVFGVTTPFWASISWWRYIIHDNHYYRSIIRRIGRIKDAI